ncbi:MAG: hypothetical protein KAJ64_00480, partial [Thermoplasmata archaeon]|nr:hypothetical protein [Thermoplasmata archaeon]
ELIDMIGITDKSEILARIDELAALKKPAFGEPIVVQFVEREKTSQMKSLSGKISMHKDLLVDPYLDVEEMVIT